MRELKARNPEGEAPLPCPSPELGAVIVPPYLLGDTPKPVFKMYCIVCIMVRSSWIADLGIPQLWRAILMGG
jgi:hypothetical protein